jgi:hypothetical protein
MTTIQLSDDYRLHFSINEVSSPSGCLNLKIESQWLGAKDPDARQTRYQTTLTRADALKVAVAILKEAAR